MWCGACACPSTFRACDVELEVIAEAVTYVPTGITLVAETTNLSPGADSVIHLLDSSGAQLASNDDFGGTRRSRVSFTAGFGGKSVRIMARAKSASTTGTATLRYQSISTNITLGHAAFSVAAPRAGETLVTARLPYDGGADHGDSDGPGTVRFDPNADGISALAYSDFDDWKVMRVGLCETKVAYGPISDLACATPDW